jgi:hypothetical protein
MLARMKLFPDMVCLYPRVGPQTRFHYDLYTETLVSLQLKTEKALSR